MKDILERGYYLIDDEVIIREGVIRYQPQDIEEEGKLDGEVPGLYDCEGRKLRDPKPKRHRKYKNKKAQNNQKQL